MKKNKKIMKSAVLGVVLSIFAMIGVGASSASFSGYVPAYNGKAYTPSRIKSTNGLIAYLVVDNQGNEEVTFRVGPFDGSNYGQGYIVSQSQMGKQIALNFKKEYRGKEVNAQYNNHNWTNHKGFISGTIDYN
mgnify:CR=1 FL=1